MRIGIFTCASIGIALLANPAFPESTASATVAQESRNIVDRLERVVKVRTKQIQVRVWPEAEIVLPDGDSRIVIDSKIGKSYIQDGTRYSLWHGIIRYWTSMNWPLGLAGSFFHVSFSDDIGLGRIYFSRKFLERARGGRLGVGYQLRGITFLSTVGRTSWVFRSRRSGDSVRVRAILGEAFNIHPRLPLRDTFAIGGPAGVKGYGYEEFRGNGKIFLGGEHDWLLPLSFGGGWVDLSMDRIYAVGFAETGRVENGGFRPLIRWKHSAGMGVRFEETVLRRYDGSMRFYLAQAEGMTSRSPVFYAMLDVK